MPIWTLLDLLIFAGLLVSVLLISRGFDATGSWLAGLTIAAAGWLFAGIGLLAAQLYEDTESALRVVFALLFASLIPMVLNNCPSVNHMLFHPAGI